MLRWKDSEFLTYLRQTRTRPKGYELKGGVFGESWLRVLGPRAANSSRQESSRHYASIWRQETVSAPRLKVYFI